MWISVSTARLMGIYAVETIVNKNFIIFMLFSYPHPC